MQHEICSQHVYENEQMDKFEQMYIDQDWNQIQHIRDSWQPKKGEAKFEPRDNEYYSYSGTIEEHFTRVEVIPNSEDCEINFDEIISLQQKINKSKTQMEEKIYQATLDELSKKLKQVEKKY